MTSFLCRPSSRRECVDGALCVAVRRAASAESLAFLVAAWRRVDARHSVVVASVVLTRWRVSAIVGVVNVTRGLFVLSCSVEFFACRLILVGRRILTPLIQVRVLEGELRNICAHAWVRRCFSRWRCARVVEGADCNSAHVGSIPTSVSGAASPRRRVAGLAGLACAAYPRRPMGKTTDFGSVNLGSSPSGDAKGGCANALPASTIDAPRGGREAHHLWVISMSLRAI